MNWIVQPKDCLVHDIDQDEREAQPTQGPQHVGEDAHEARLPQDGAQDPPSREPHGAQDPDLPCAPSSTAASSVLSTPRAATMRAMASRA